MKVKKFLCTLLLLACSYSASSFAQDKIYIFSTDIMIAEKDIFVKIDDYVYKTNNIFHDEIGIYLIDFKAVKCPDCERNYPIYEKECPYKELHDTDNGHNSN